MPDPSIDGSGCNHDHDITICLPKHISVHTREPRLMTATGEEYIQRACLIERDARCRTDSSKMCKGGAEYSAPSIEAEAKAQILGDD